MDEIGASSRRGSFFLGQCLLFPDGAYIQPGRGKWSWEVYLEGAAYQSNMTFCSREM